MGFEHRQVSRELIAERACGKADEIRARGETFTIGRLDDSRWYCLPTNPEFAAMAWPKREEAVSCAKLIAGVFHYSP